MKHLGLVFVIWGAGHHAGMVAHYGLNAPTGADEVSVVCFVVGIALILIDLFIPQRQSPPAPQEDSR